MLSTSSKYAMTAVLHLAEQTDENHKKMVKDLSLSTHIPKAYLAKILQQLSRHQVISSTKGPKGGYYLTKENRNLPVYRIIEVIDGTHRLESCVLGLDECNAANPCPLHEYINPSRTILLTTLKRMSIDELSGELTKDDGIIPSKEKH